MLEIDDIQCRREFDIWVEQDYQFYRKEVKPLDKIIDVINSYAKKKGVELVFGEQNDLDSLLKLKVYSCSKSLSPTLENSALIGVVDFTDVDWNSQLFNLKDCIDFIADEDTSTFMSKTMLVFSSR